MDEELDDELDFDSDLLSPPVDDLGLSLAAAECSLSLATDDLGLGCHASLSKCAGVGACESAEVYIEVAVERAECAREGALGGRGGGPERVVLVEGVMLNALGGVFVPEDAGEGFLVAVESTFAAAGASCAFVSLFTSP